MPPTIEVKSLEKQLEEIKGLISPAHYVTLEQFLGPSPHFKYHYYLWAGEEHLYKVTQDGQRIEVDYDKQNRSEAMNERKQALQSLLGAAVDVFREVYLKHIEHDSHYYGFWDMGGFGNGDEKGDAINILIERGYCASKEDAQRKIDENDIEAMGIIDKIYFDEVDKDASEMHDERFWEWDEEENIGLAFNTQFFHQ